MDADAKRLGGRGSKIGTSERWSLLAPFHGQDW